MGFDFGAWGDLSMVLIDAAEFDCLHTTIKGVKYHVKHRTALNERCFAAMET